MNNNEEPKSKFKTEEKGKKKQYKNHLIVGDFEQFNFEKLLAENESEEYEGILWKNGSIDKNGKFSRDIKVKKNDIVYICYTNLPDRINRILVRCSVLDTSDENENCFYYESSEEKEKMQNGQKPRIPAMRLKFKNALCITKDKEKFSEEKLRNEYGINNLQGKQHLKEDLVQRNIGSNEKNNYQKRLIEDLEKNCNSNKYKNYSLVQLTEDINKMSKCTLEDCRGLKNANHQTFQKENGMNYYESHHLIEQCNGRNDEKFPKEIIDDPKNIVNLCSNCHKRIHHGKKEDRKLMVTYLYNKNKDEYDKLLSNIKEVKSKDDALLWLLKQYGVNS